MAPPQRDIRDLLRDGTFRLDRHSALLDPVVLRVYKATGGGPRGCRAALHALDHADELAAFDELQQLFAVAVAWCNDVNPLQSGPDDFDDALVESRRRMKVVSAIQDEYHAHGTRLDITDYPPITSVVVPEDERDDLRDRVEAWEVAGLTTACQNSKPVPDFPSSRR